MPHLTTLERKLAALRFSHMTPKMAAMVEAVIEPPERYAAPCLGGLSITSDGWVLAVAGNPVNHEVFLGAASDWERNWAGLLDAAGLTAGERAEAERRYRQNVKDWRS